MKKYTYKIKSLTPIFSYGADQSIPEIRATSIRGNLSWWFKALNEELKMNSIMGQIAKKDFKGNASKIIVRVENIIGNVLPTAKLPHKTGGHSAISNAYQEGTSFEVNIIHKRQLSKDESKVLDKVIDAWLMLGSLGGRSTRGGGNICDCNIEIKSSQDWQIRADSFLKGTKLKACILDCVEGENDSAIRKIFTDTIKMESNRFPLGSVDSKTKISPLKFKLVEIAKEKYIAAIWDGRDNSNLDLKFAIDKLSEARKPIGELLMNSNLYKNLIY